MKIPMSIVLNADNTDEGQLIFQIKGHRITVTIDTKGVAATIHRGEMLLTDCGIDWTEANDEDFTEKEAT